MRGKVVMGASKCEREDGIVTGKAKKRGFSGPGGARTDSFLFYFFYSVSK